MYSWFFSRAFGWLLFRGSKVKISGNQNIAFDFWVSELVAADSYSIHFVVVVVNEYKLIN